MTGTSSDRVEAVQAVVDRVSSYQDGASKGTVETELRTGLDDAGLDLSDHDVGVLAEAIESKHGAIDVDQVLRG
jgi:hypothetical protein